MDIATLISLHKISSFNAQVQEWARTHNIPNQNIVLRFTAEMKATPFDYLFSIVNDNKKKHGMDTAHQNFSYGHI